MRGRNNNVFWLFVWLWAATCIACLLTMQAKSETATEPLNRPQSIAEVDKLLCVQEDYENAKIESALYESGYFRADIPMDSETQAYLRAACEESGIEYELALAVIWQETDYQNIIGDDGDSQGFMQIQRKWHGERMERLGVTDLNDPFSNFRVGCDFLSELLGQYSLSDALTYYNSGRAGVSQYAESVMDKLEVLR